MLVLAIAGMVGAGKTTLTRSLATRFGLQLALESVDADNPWLGQFYGGPEDMRRYALMLQLHFLATRFASVRKMRGQGGPGFSTGPGTRTPRFSPAGCTSRG